MHPRLASSAHILLLHDRRLPALTQGIAGDAWLRLDPSGHNVAWLLGHIAAIRVRALALAGAPQAEPPWAGAFARGTKPDQLPIGTDGPALLQAFLALGPTLQTALDRLGDDELARPAGRTFPDGSDTIGGGIAFIAWHEAYHVGQIGLLRRLLGLPGLI